MRGGWVVGVCVWVVRFREGVERSGRWGLACGPTKRTCERGRGRGSLLFDFGGRRVGVYA